MERTDNEKVLAICEKKKNTMKKEKRGEENWFQKRKPTVTKKEKEKMGTKKRKEERGKKRLN